MGVSGPATTMMGTVRAIIFESPKFTASGISFKPIDGIGFESIGGISFEPMNSDFGSLLEVIGTANSGFAQSVSGDLVREASHQYVAWLGRAASALRYGNSAFGVLQREIQQASASAGSALDYLRAASVVARDLADQANTLANNIDALTRATRISVTSEFLELPKEASDFIFGTSYLEEKPGSSELFWRRIRDELQSRFGMSLRDLAPLLNVAYPTIVNLGKMRHQPRTARAVERVHAVTSALVRALGDDTARAWLRNEGVTLLRGKGFARFRQAALQAAYGTPRLPKRAIRFDEEPELVGREDADLSNSLGAEAF